MASCECSFADSPKLFSTKSSKTGLSVEDAAVLFLVGRRSGSARCGCEKQKSRRRRWSCGGSAAAKLDCECHLQHYKPECYLHSTAAVNQSRQEQQGGPQMVGQGMAFLWS